MTETQCYNPTLRIRNFTKSSYDTINEDYALAEYILFSFNPLPEGRVYAFFHGTGLSKITLNPHKIICYDWLLTKKAKLENDRTELRQKHMHTAIKANLYNTYTPELSLYIGYKSVLCTDTFAPPRDALVRSNADPLWAIHLALHQADLDTLKRLSATITRAEQLLSCYTVLIQIIINGISRHFSYQEIYILLLDGVYILQKSLREGTIIPKSELESKIIDISHGIRNIQFSPKRIKAV